MLRDRLSASDVTPQDIGQLITDGVNESIDLEFKAEVPNKNELLKDACAMANIGSGFIVIGVVETDERASGLQSVPDATRQKDFIRQTIRDGIEPRVFAGTEVLKVPFGGIDYIVIVCRIEAQDGPHMVASEKRSDFYKRYDRTTNRLTYGEIESAFREKSRRQGALTRVETPSRLIETVSGRTNLDESTVAAIDRYVADILRSDRPMIGFVTVAEGNTEKLTPPVAVNSLIAPAYDRRGGWLAAMRGFDVRTQSGTAYQQYGDIRLTYVTADADVVLHKYIDEVLCWSQDAKSFADRPRLNPLALLEYAVSYCMLLKVVYKHTRPQRSISIPVAIGVGNTVLPLGTPGTGAFEAPLVSANPPNEDAFRGKPVVNEYRGLELGSIGPRRLAFQLVSQLYEFYGHRANDVPLSRDGVIMFNRTEDEVRGDSVDTVRSFLQEHFGNIEREWEIFDRDATGFRMQSSKIFVVSRELLEDFDQEELTRQLVSWRVEEVVKKQPTVTRWLLTNGGISADPYPL